MTAVLLDMDGVLYEGSRVIEGARSTIDELRRRHIPFRFVTNTTSRSRDVLVTELAAMGIEAEASEIINPLVVAARWIRAHQCEPAAVFVPATARGEFDQIELLADTAESGARCVVIGDLRHDWNFDVMNRAFRLLMNEPDCALVALGMTRYWRDDRGWWLDVAPFVHALESATERSPVVAGKPGSILFDAAVEAIGVARHEVVMVGDDIRSDIGGALASGLRAVLVRTGKFRASDLDEDIQPSAVLGSVAELIPWIDSGGGGD